jgi:Asp-tRNA(Asn)/Glu-tRNA(Gln) amidotransferase A subunit family amidase
MRIWSFSRRSVMQSVTFNTPGPPLEVGSFAFPINLSQQPAVSMPCGLTAAGLPIGLQFVGARGADAKVLSAARDFGRVSR